MKKLLMLCSLVVMLVGIMAFSATAAQMTGAISFAGNNTVNDPSLLDATAFSGFGPVWVTTGAGTWSGITPTSPATFSPFSFITPPDNFPLWSFGYADDVFSMTAFGTSVTYKYAVGGSGLPQLDVSGFGTITATGTGITYEPTPGAWTITANQGLTTFSFSSSSVVVTPEPFTLLLLGCGLVGCAAAARKFKK